MPCPGGGIGRRAVLRGQCPHGRAGSTPVPGTEQSPLPLSEAGFFHGFTPKNKLDENPYGVPESDVPAAQGDQDVPYGQAAG